MVVLCCWINNLTLWSQVVHSAAYKLDIWLFIQLLICLNLSGCLKLTMSVWIIHLPSVCPPPPPQYASIGLCPSGMRGICSRSSSWQVGRCPIIHCTGFAMHGTPHIQPFIVSGSSTITFAFADTHPNCTGRCVWPWHGQ